MKGRNVTATATATLLALLCGTLTSAQSSSDRFVPSPVSGVLTVSIPPPDVEISRGSQLEIAVQWDRDLREQAFFAYHVSLARQEAFVDGVGVWQDNPSVVALGNLSVPSPFWGSGPTADPPVLDSELNVTTPAPNGINTQTPEWSTFWFETANLVPGGYALRVRQFVWQGSTGVRSLGEGDNQAWYMEPPFTNYSSQVVLRFFNVTEGGNGTAPEPVVEQAVYTRTIDAYGNPQNPPIASGAFSALSSPFALSMALPLFAGVANFVMT